MGKFDMPIANSDEPTILPIHETRKIAEAIKIDPNGRYLFILESSRELSQAEFDVIKGKIQEWWDSGKSVGVVASTPALRFRVERVDE